MGASGVIFAVLAVACLFYIVPRQLTWRIPTQKEAEQQTPLHLAMKTVHSGRPHDLASARQVDGAGLAAVSTLLMRRAGRRAALRLAGQAEKRRRAVFAVLLVIMVATVPFAALRLWIHWWVPLAVFGVVLAWVVYARFEARRVQRQLDAIVADTELGDDEKTVTVQLQSTPEPVSPQRLDAVVGPNGDVQLSLWDPITVVPATYMSTPTSARTVRTIDLKPQVSKLPVTDDGQLDKGLRRVV